MRVLLDESVPRQLGAALVGHSVSTVAREGWSGLRNGELLANAAASFDVFITGDRNLEHQQAYSRLPIGIVVLIARNNRVETILDLAGPILIAIGQVEPGQLIHVGRLSPTQDPE